MIDQTIFSSKRTEFLHQRIENKESKTKAQHWYTIEQGHWQERVSFYINKLITIQANVLDLKYCTDDTT